MNLLKELEITVSDYLETKNPEDMEKVKKIWKNLNRTNPHCKYYNWGGNGTKERPSYPREYGARCEYYDEFFSKDNTGRLSPHCYTCQEK